MADPSDGLAVFVLAAVLVEVGQRVEHGMMQQIHTVVDLEVSFDDVFLGDQRAVPVVLDAEGIHFRRIAYRYGNLKEMLAEAFVNIGRYPSLAEVEIQFLELDAFGCGLTKQRERTAAGIVVGEQNRYLQSPDASRLPGTLASVRTVQREGT